MSVRGRVVSKESVVVEGKVEEMVATARARSAAQYGRLTELEQLLNSGALGVNDRDEEECTLLQWAAINNRGEVVRALLRLGADPRACGGILEETAMQWAVRQGHVDPCVVLREAGCDPLHKGVEGGNVVHLACRYGKHMCLAYLLARDETPPGPSVGLMDLPDERGRTPLMICVEWYWQNPRSGLETLRMLLAFGASVNFAEAQGGRTALHFAAERNLERGALEPLVEAGASLDAEDGEGRTPEAVALAGGHSHTVLILRSHRPSDCVNALGRLCYPRRWCWASKAKQEVSSEKRGLLDEETTEGTPTATVKKNAVRRRSGKWCAATYGMLSPWVGFFAVVYFAADRGWQHGLAVATVAPVVLAPLAPRGTSRWGMCGFASVSIGLIFGSFFVAGFHLVTPAWVVALYVALVCGLVFNFVLAIVKDPGTIDAPREDRILHIVQLGRSGKLAQANLCSTCLIEKPPRSKHDPTLGKCVRRFDHYCPYVANVVGQGNYLYFYLFLLFVVAAIGLHLLVVAPHVVLVECTGHQRPELCITDHKNAPAILGACLGVFHLLWVSALACVHTNLVWRDQTTYESMRATPTVIAQPGSCFKRGFANAKNALCTPVPPLQFGVGLNEASDVGGANAATSASKTKILQ